MATTSEGAPSPSAKRKPRSKLAKRYPSDLTTCAVNNLALQALVATYAMNKTILDETPSAPPSPWSLPNNRKTITTTQRPSHRQHDHQGPPNPGTGPSAFPNSHNQRDTVVLTNGGGQQLVASAEDAVVAKDFLADAGARNVVAPQTIPVDRAGR